jgi:DNA-binding CsgD family transcriptional regulator
LPNRPVTHSLTNYKHFGRNKVFACVNYKKKVHNNTGVANTFVGDTGVHSGIFRGELDDEQRAVFAQILNGKTGRDIATILGATPTRIEAIVRKTCRQLGASNRHEAARTIAGHYGWKPIPPIEFAHLNGRKHGSHYRTENGNSSAKMAQTEREQIFCSGYVCDVGIQGPERDKDAGVYSEVAGRISNSKIIAASPTMQCVLVMSALIASCALALSTLVSAMQGFDTLFFS